MSIPLVQNNEKDSINTSIIAIKRNIERINMLLGLVDSGSPDLSGLATKQELQDAISQVETDLTPVDEVTSGNMQSVTSNAVAIALNSSIKRRWTETKSASSGNGSDIVWNCLETYDGLKLCFGTATVARSSIAWGNIYYSGGTDDQWFFPTNFFTQTPYCSMEVSNDTSSGSLWLWTPTQTRGLSKTKTKEVCPACAQPFSNVTMRYDILAIGV
jgi:hypothetical protein